VIPEMKAFGEVFLGTTVTRIAPIGFV